MGGSLYYWPAPLLLGLGEEITADSHLVTLQQVLRQALLTHGAPHLNTQGDAGVPPSSAALALCVRCGSVSAWGQESGSPVSLQHQPCAQGASVGPAEMKWMPELDHLQKQQERKVNL